jgi:hypothetical protein
MTKVKNILPEDLPEEDDYYDDEGNESLGGLFDAGGHPIPERFADYADWLRDDAKYRQ